MNQSVFSRRIFLKGSAVAATALALSACGGGNETVHYPAQTKTLSLGTLKIEIVAPFVHSENNRINVEFRFKITNNSDTPVTLSPDNFSFKFNDQPVSLTGNKLSNSSLPYFFDNMPIPENQSVTGYLLIPSEKAEGHYQVTINYLGKEDTFDFVYGPQEWYE
mgnify:CR=1 FL=1